MIDKILNIIDKILNIIDKLYKTTSPRDVLFNLTETTSSKNCSNLIESHRYNCQIQLVLTFVEPSTEFRDYHVYQITALKINISRLFCLNYAIFYVFD